MPLKPGSSQKTVSSNIRELMHAWSSKGSIGHSGRISKEKARKMAIAIAYQKAKKKKKKRRGRK